MSTDRTCNAPPPQRASARAERRTWMTVGLTLATMVAELIAGSLTRSLALTADGWHMATHAGALGLSALAYWYARTRAHAAGFAFGTGKVHALAGFTNALLLLAVAASMVVEAVERFVHPERIRYTEALVVAVLGLGVNLVSAWLLQGSHAHHDHDHDHHDHDHTTTTTTTTSARPTCTCWPMRSRVSRRLSPWPWGGGWAGAFSTRSAPSRAACSSRAGRSGSCARRVGCCST
jgi:cation diffusion facilitator family transporter